MLEQLVSYLSIKDRSKALYPLSEGEKSVDFTSFKTFIDPFAFPSSLLSAVSVPPYPQHRLVLSKSDWSHWDFWYTTRVLVVDTGDTLTANTNKDGHWQLIPLPDVEMEA